MKEKSENFNSLRSILFELCKKNYRGGQIAPPPAGIGLSVWGGTQKTNLHQFQNQGLKEHNLFILHKNT